MQINEQIVKSLPTPESGNKVHYFPDAILQGKRAPAGFGVRITSKGVRAFILNYRIRGQEFRYTIGRYPTWSVLAAVNEARDLRQRIERGENPLDSRSQLPPIPSADTFSAVIDNFIKRHINKQDLRSKGEYVRILDRYVRPRLGDRSIYEIKRSDVTKMLDAVESENGASMADHVLSRVRTVFNWQATRDDRFFSPIVPGMARTKPKERARQRVLTDAELRVVWNAAEDAKTTYGHMLQFILLTATRLREAARMHRDELIGEDWLIPAARHKSKSDFLLPLSKLAQEILAQRPEAGFVFPSARPRVPLGGFSKLKPKFDEHVLALLRKQDTKADPLPRWTTHDLRRTARSLMSRAGVPPDHSERALGHVLLGVRGVYDRHEYRDEKRKAFEALATTIRGILKGCPPGHP